MPRIRGCRPRQELKVLFFDKIMEGCPSSVKKSHWIEFIFGVHQVFIIQYTVKKEFNIPGLYMLTYEDLIPGYGNRLLREGKRVMLRANIRYPNVIEVETDIDAFGATRCFRVTESDWCSKIKSNLIPTNEKSQKEIEAWDHALTDQRLRRRYFKGYL